MTAGPWIVQSVNHDRVLRREQQPKLVLDSRSDLVLVDQLRSQRSSPQSVEFGQIRKWESDAGDPRRTELSPPALAAERFQLAMLRSRYPRGGGTVFTRPRCSCRHGCRSDSSRQPCGKEQAVAAK